MVQIPEPYLFEMICDWIGAGKAQGFNSPKDDRFFETRNWFKVNKHKMQLHKNTSKKIENILNCRSNAFSMRDLL